MNAIIDDRLKHKIITSTKLGMIQARTKFLEDFPNANLEKFSFDVDLSDTGVVEKTHVYYKVDEDTGYDITSDTFWDNKTWVKALGLTKIKEAYYSLYGKNFLHARSVIKRTKDKMIEKFKKDYPNANV